MKFFLALCLCFGAANAISLDSLRSMLENELEDRTEERRVTLSEYLDSLEEPHPYYRSLEERAEKSSAGGGASAKPDCSKICGPPPKHSDVTCKTKEWVPNYEKTGQCECLTSYKCCDGTCPATDLKSCWANGNKGKKYGQKAVDCCGCEVVHCYNCANVDDESSACYTRGSKPLSCMAYDPKGKQDAESGCFEATCMPKGSDAPASEVCDKACQAPKGQTSTCGFPYRTCEASRKMSNCPKAALLANAPKLPTKCYSAPYKVKDPLGGKYWDEGAKKCEQCDKWKYDKKSCSAQDAATAAADCHQYGPNEMDKKCMKKVTLKDECECNKYTCSVSHSETESKFNAGEVCPKHHVKMTGTSICGVVRDVCFPCPSLVEAKDVPCAVGAVILTKDINGCPERVCQPPTIAPGACSSKKYRLDASTNQLNCV